MAQNPLLVFPRPALAGRAIRPHGPGRLHLPDARDQGQRLAPQLLRLQRAMENRRLALKDSSLGLQPEQALVLETIGPIENFIKAVRKIPGLEWLSEFEVDEIEPEFGFHDDAHPERPLRGFLFLVMTDQRALNELHRLFSRWRKDASLKFPRDLAPLKSVFLHLHTIRPWGPEDRIRETGLIEDWQARLGEGQESVPFEAELWFRAAAARRDQAYSYAKAVVESVGGELLQQCAVPEIRYHGVLGHIPRGAVPGVIARSPLSLFQCEDVMFLRPVGQCMVRVPGDLSETGSIKPSRTTTLPEGEPEVALLDGMPLTRHSLLDGRLEIDDPDDYQSAYQAQERRHGTAMASLICHGDLSDAGAPMTKLLYVRPIMQPYRAPDGTFVEERIPESVLPVDLLHRSVRRLFENEGEEPPAAPNVRVINLSICDRSRPFYREISALARTLDWLSCNHNVLFIVSAGNHVHDLELGIARSDLGSLSDLQLEQAIIRALAADTRHRRLLSPAETLNGLTIGATHADGSAVPGPPSLLEPFATAGLPSPVSAHGPGYRRSIKPEVFLPGGRQLLREKLGTTHSQATLQVPAYITAPGQESATPGLAGQLDRTCYSRGTSNSAALATRSAMNLLSVLEGLRLQRSEELPQDYDPLLLKSLLVHGAEWARAGTAYEAVLSPSRDRRTFAEYVGRFLGYGAVVLPRVIACTDERVTVVGVGKLGDGEAHEFALPLPPSLSAVALWRRLTITLSWFSPVESARHAYRVAHLWFDAKNDLAPERKNADHRAVVRGTVQHEVLEGEAAVDFQDGDQMVIKVNCRADAADIEGPIAYALVVTLEVAEGIAIPIYEEVRARLHVKVPVPGGVTVQVPRT
jgi:hypothetical protein